MIATTAASAGTGVRKGEGNSARRDPDVPRGITWAAYAVPLCALPSGLWRIALVVGWPDWYAGHEWLPGERPYVLSLSLVAECLALLTLGLVRPWGERLPAWVPFAGGRVVPVRAAVVPASIGAFLATALGAYATLNYIFHFVPPLNDNGEAFPTSGPGAWALWACYVPILAWGPLLAVVTRAYYVRRNRGMR
ncbi:hypothetical protein [Streptomyces sp. NBC_00091]|uniref:hypothetical protein n=1 Tax=Streptomyces sp. NBC_00091 TaxID=2975648 RepID=UPI0022515E7E|nr:hypothetical protein [Streptomyces sp. NBC_00091]MCX5377298.1 hypothetical protein [Streptomyces sp. NBC_00091]